MTVLIRRKRDRFVDTSDMTCMFSAGKVIFELIDPLYPLQDQGVGGWGLGSARMTGGYGALGFEPGPRVIARKNAQIMHFVHVLLIQ
jgi:hypothetical protein